ncbi:pentatricopeptide repeat-containing protein At3g22150, chloroplastic-like [Magnolia sinica]|uniref:pentatricopeptide repeat-containing protein At3g22150, chloroplastic-like n=1 Tax=Magnolia sinica TaxID=86752 RepID=UPI0026599068|nr:pentatricopeptide repeat-containing protein At3g22150, chloroplastic-like [Magnolia sinica]
MDPTLLKTQPDKFSGAQGGPQCKTDHQRGGGGGHRQTGQQGAVALPNQQCTVGLASRLWRHSQIGASSLMGIARRGSTPTPAEHVTSNPTGGTGAGKQLHGFAVRHFLDGNVFVGTALVDMYSKCGVIDYAERVFNRIPERNSVTYTTMISGYGQHGLAERALSLFYAMPKTGMKPDTVTFIAVLSACSYAGLVDEGLRIFESMEKEYGIPATPEHYCCIVDMLGRAGRVADAYEYVSEMGDDGNLVGVWGSLLGACRIHGEFELGKLVAERLIEMESGKDVGGYHVLLSNIYAEEGNWENVDRVRKGMREKGLWKEAGRSWIQVGGIVHYFMSRDQMHPQRDEIYTMLEELVVEMKAAGYGLSVCSNMDEAFENEE